MSVPIFGFIVSASKGPLIAILLLWLCTTTKKIAFTKKAIIASVVAFLGAFFVILGRGSIVTENSVSSREYLYGVSFNIISKNFFIPEDLNTFKNITGVEYPHNLFLDVWMNTGFTSLVFLLTMLLILLYIGVFSKKCKFLNSSVLYLFFCMMFSFSYFDMVKLMIPLSFISMSYFFHENFLDKNKQGS